MKQLNLYYLGGGAGPSVPDGKTVTPINDVQIWQQCAGLIPTYTTLAEVLNDSGYVRALMNSDNAVDYMVRSTGWATEQALVPTMTSNTTPEGVAFASAEGSTQPAYRAFDNNTSTDAVVGDASGEGYIGYQFTSSTIVGGCYVDASVNNRLQSYKLQGSNDGSSWTDITDTITVPSTYISSAHFSNTVAYDYIRLYQVAKSTNNVGYYTIQFYSASIPTSETAMQYIGANDYAANELLGNVTWREAVCGSEYFGHMMNIKVPVMTSNTTPSGECICRSSTSGCEAYRAFNYDSSTFYNSAENVANEYIGYIFTAASRVQWCVADLGTNSSNTVTNTVKIQGSNDSFTSADDLTASFTYTTNNQSMVHIVQELNNIASYSGYRVLRTSSYLRFAANNIQFYGREVGGVQTWLKSAGITDKTYTTLSQVLNDTTVLAALMNSTNAVNYLVTATSWASTICADQNAMNYIGLSNYASNTLLANDTWRTAICNSTYFESVLNVKVPTMTSNTTPSGECYFDGTIYAGSAYNAYDQNSSTGVQMTGHSNTVGYSRYRFSSLITIYKAVVTRMSSTGTSYVGEIAGSLDNVTWDMLDPSQKTEVSNNVFVLPTVGDYYQYRVKLFCNGGTSYTGFVEVQFYGRTAE